MDLKRLESFLAPLMKSSALRRAESRAVNAAAARARTKASLLIREKWNLPGKVVNQRLKLNVKASTASSLVVLTAASRPLSLVYFGAVWYFKHKSEQRVVTGKMGRRLKRSSEKSGVYVTMEKGKPHHYPHSFIAPGRRGGGLTDAGVSELGTSGHLGVFHREGKARIPIKERKNITVASMFGQERVQKPVSKLIGEVYEKEFYRQLRL